MSLWDTFRDRFPNADLSKLSIQGNEVVHKEPDGTFDVFDRFGKFRPSLCCFSRMKRDLGMSRFPLELTLDPKPTLEVPAV